MTRSARAADVGRRFAAGAAVSEYVPVGLLLLNLGGCEALIFTVVPFDEIAVDGRDGAEAG